MREFKTVREAAESSFLFISYSHDDNKDGVITAWVDYLVKQGVCVCWDKLFLGGDDWETIAIELLSHENCRGILFFGSNSAIESPNVAKEWLAAAKTKQNRSESDFYPQIIMVSDDLNYKQMAEKVRAKSELFSADDFDDFRDLFGKKDHLYYSANNEEDKRKLLDTIKVRSAETIDDLELTRDKLVELSTTGQEVVLRLGTYGDDYKPIFWKQVKLNVDEIMLLCQNVLADDFGGEKIADWLKVFVRDSFSSEEQSMLQGKIRLLTVEEAESIPEEDLATEKIWWLDDCEGNLQAVVREDGTVYKKGYNNKLYKKGVRPVVTLNGAMVSQIVEIQNRK